MGLSLLLAALSRCASYGESSGAGAASLPDASTLGGDDGATEAQGRPQVGSDDAATDAADGDASATPCSEPRRLVGVGTVAPSPDTVANGTLDAYGYPVGLDVADEVARCVWIYLATSSGEGASVGVYGGSINAPGELLASAKLVRAPIAGWNGLVLDRPISLKGQSTIWIGLLASVAIPEIRNEATNCALGDARRLTQGGLKSVPEIFTASGGNPSQCLASFYLGR